MRRILIAVLVGLVLGGVARADGEAKQIKGQVQQLDAKQHVLKIKVNGKEQTIRFKDDTPFVDQNGKPLGKQARIKQLVPGAQVTIVMQKQGAKQGPQQIAQIQIQTIRTKQKPDGKTKPDQASPKQKEQPKQKKEKS
ncbi:MAG TPA: hypothetical protein VMG10_27145 [Gemmataceae bacterium]|nr:hypothetical protein [Gemmataceae bacterium]